MNWMKTRLKAAALPPHALAVCVIAIALAPAVSAQAVANATRGEPITVRSLPLERVLIRPEREAPANVVARNTSKLAAEMSGTVQAWTRELGQSVARGELLVQLDPQDAQIALRRARAALAAAEAELRLANAQWERARQLVAQNFLSQEALAQRDTERVRAQTALDRERAALETAERDLARTRVLAPFAATVSERRAQVGETVAPGTLLYVLTERGHDEVQATLAPTDVPGLRGAGAWQLASPVGTHALRLLGVTDTVNAPARTQTARFTFVNPSDAPPPGTSGTLRWSDAQAQLPPNLLVRRASALGIFVLEGERARFVPVPGAQEGRTAAPPTALTATTPVVVQGQDKLQDGLSVRIER